MDAVMSDQQNGQNAAQNAGQVSGHGVALGIEACGKTFPDGTRALEPVTLHVARGETLVLLGPSGCGKTTLLRIIAGLETPDAGGRLLFNDADVTRVPIERRNVGMVFQSYALFPNMDVADNIGYGLKIRGVPDSERKARIAELVKLTGIEGLEHRRIDQLSGGQRQRVALARAVAARPSVLLLDEPLTALDAALRDRLRGELNRLLRTLGITAIYVTHDQAEAMALGDRIVVMRKGAIAQIGTPREIYFAPANRFVAEFVGAANIVEAQCDAGALMLPGGKLPLTQGAINGHAGNTVFAMIRPESIRVVAPDGAALAGQVDSVSFVGDRQRAWIGGVAAKAITVDVPNSTAIKAGDRVGLAIDPAAIRLLPGDAP
jgi:putative spermidine/putrescine transport system ATP-binding protein